MAMGNDWLWVIWAYEQYCPIIEPTSVTGKRKGDIIGGKTPKCPLHAPQSLTLNCEVTSTLKLSILMYDVRAYWCI